MRQLSHINGNWELTWDESLEQYKTEDDSLASSVNDLIEELSSLEPPLRYHDNEDRLAERTNHLLGWDIKKVGKRWICEDYPVVLQQGSFNGTNQRDLMLAVAGRVMAAMKYGQMHFDEMERTHQKMLADVLAIVLYHRAGT